MAEFNSPEDLDKWISGQRELYEAGIISAKELHEAQKDYAAGIKGYTANLKASMAQLGTSFKSLGKDIYDGKQSATVLNDSMSSGANAVAAYAAKFGPAGVAVGLFTKAVVGFVNAALKQSDALYDSYAKISRTGTVGSQAMGEVFNQMVQFGYTVEQLGDMGNLLAANSKNFGMFSRSALDGARAFGEVADNIQNSPIRKQFFALGLSVNDINEGIAGYLNQQGKLGQLQGKTTKEQTQAAINYIKELDVMTKLTGMTRQEQEEAREQALQIESFYAGLMDLTEKEQEQALKTFTNVFATGGPKAAADMAASFNGVITAGGAMFLSTGGESMKYYGKEFFKNGGTMEQSMAGIKNSITPAMRELTKNVEQVGGQFGLGSRTLTMLAKDGVDPLAQVMENLTDKQKAAMAGVDPATKAQAGMRDNQIKSSQSMASFVNLGVNPATRALEIFTDVVETLTSFLPGVESAKKRREAAENARKEAVENAKKETDKKTTAPAAEVVKVSGSAEAKASAEKYLGKAISDSEFSALIKATHAEAAGGKQASQQEQAMIMASVLNRARTDKGGIMGALTAKNAFQSVTGTANEPGPSQQYLKGPEKDRLQSIEGATQLLQNISQQQKNFTAASAAAYGPGTNISYRDKMLAAGGTTIGGSVFQTAPMRPAVQVAAQEIPAGPDYGGMPMAKGGILSGPSSGYRPNIVMHGTEAIVPLNTPAQQTAAAGGMDSGMLSAQIDRLDEMISIMKNQLGVSTRIMQSSA
jgi:hypothetical protein